MKITKEEELKVMIDRISHKIDISPGEGRGDVISRTEINVKALAELLVELVNEIENPTFKTK